MLCSFAATACDRCGYTSSSSGPLQYGADGKPFNGAVPPDFAAAPVVSTCSRAVRVRGFPWRSHLARLRRVLKQHSHRESPADERTPSDIELDDEFGLGPPLSKREQRELDAALERDFLLHPDEPDQRALDAATDSDNESYTDYEPAHRHGSSPYATTPSARPLSPSGGFGPFTGREVETPEDYASTAAEDNDWPDEPISTAALSPSRIVSDTVHNPGIADQPSSAFPDCQRHVDSVLDPGTHAQQTSRDIVYEDPPYDDDPHEDGFYGGDLYEDHSYGADFYEDHVNGGDFDDYDSDY